MFSFEKPIVIWKQTIENEQVSVSKFLIDDYDIEKIVNEIQL